MSTIVVEEAGMSDKVLELMKDPNYRPPSLMRVDAAYHEALAALRAHPHMDFRTAVRRVLGTSEWRSDEDRINAAEAKRQRKMQRNVRNRRS